ncbi:MAG: DUF2157 domain-containing protein [Nitratireductor sp.]|nr:DUF2157 domain-containing protein [Nitratireductor sp.]
MTRITLDLDALVSEGRLTATEAERLKSLAVTGRGLSTVVQVLYVLGALGLAGGVMILKPDPVTGMALAALAIGFAIFAQATKREDLGLLGTAMGICGTVGLAGSVGMQFDGAIPAFAINVLIMAIALGGALLLRSRFLAALVPLTIAALLGSSTEYWHASYGIVIKEPLITTVLFAVLSGGGGPDSELRCRFAVHPRRRFRDRMGDNFRRGHHLHAPQPLRGECFDHFPGDQRLHAILRMVRRKRLRHAHGRRGPAGIRLRPLPFRPVDGYPQQGAGRGGMRSGDWRTRALRSAPNSPKCPS